MKKEKKDFNKAIIGNWFILYPEHELINAEQRKLYSAAQDSIVALLGLKTITFRQDGSFLQTDSILKPAGKWHFNAENNKLFIRDGGKGLEFFQGSPIDIKKDTMRIVENISLNGQNIKLTWYLKRIADKKRSVLFAEDENWWRKKTGPGNDSQLKKRIKAMLAYYALYYEMVSKESAYFSQARVFLPFRYYQHSMGLKAFDHKCNFSQLFFNTQQAEQAHAILSGAITKLQNEPFPSGEDFVIEYAKFMNKLANAIES